MTAISANRSIVPFLVFLACGVALALAIQYGRRPAVDTGAETTSPAMSKSASEAREQSPAPLAKVQSETKSVVDALIGSPPAPESNDGIPTFDVARIEPTGETVVAGRATPGATVELLRDGEVHDRAVADQSGQFVIVPPKLPPGTYDLTLRSKAPDGKVNTSRQRVTAALEPRSTEKPVVALVTPNKPTVVLSQPGAAKPGTDAVVVETVEIEPGGKFHVSGQARPGAALRLYLNDSFITSVTAGTDGRFAVTINEGVAPGNYRVRLDEASGSGTVRARAEVPFTAPDITASVSAQPTKRPDSTASQQTQLAAAGTTVVPDSSSPSSTVVVPKIATTTVSRGDSLWRLSQASYGAGMRYAVIYKANKEQIRNPNLIYPGQVFVVPAK
ncbi:LysM peptidoglycan-binding domain-containing protein [Bradyrhizobium roseum]|uniref:LysM peptidoglycan-binding domain-containing protein n=1 Tax=Bradyrhizobium roseum TaxID=3056648 RepID=UPI00262B8579|nr:LysM peptidoglycan-binding domain-containing protein [Bradyrhizobium roseus]WKA30084.1 LysM peptidoglycan-binding domain-containing protein [Bradyrhizobium roseus]